MYLNTYCPFIQRSMGSSPVFVQFTFNYHFLCISVLCLPFQNVYFLVTPFLYIVQPFSFWSSSFCFPFCLPKHHLIYQSLPVPLRVEFKICLIVYKSLHGAAPRA